MGVQAFNVLFQGGGGGGSNISVPNTASWLGLQQGIHPGLHSSSYDKTVHVSAPVERLTTTSASVNIFFCRYMNLDSTLSVKKKKIYCTIAKRLQDI